MLSRRTFLARAAALAGASSLLATSRALADVTDATPKPTEITVYKSPTCGCCTKWVDHLKANKAFHVTTKRWALSSRLRSMLESFAAIAPASRLGSPLS